MQLKRITALLLTGCMAAGMLAGCGAKPASSGSTGSSALTDSSVAAPADAGLHNLEDGVLDIGTTVSWETLTPFRTQIDNSAPYVYVAYEALGKITGDKELIPWVAKSWSVQEDGVTYDVELYDYVTDSAGNHITAADIVWFIQTSKDLALRPSFGKVESVTQTGDYTLQIKMTQDMVGAFEQVMIYTFAVSREAYENSKDEFATEIVSTSPYILTKFVSGSEISFEKRDDYWQKEELIDPYNAANVDKVSYHIILEASQAGIALETGDIDAFANLDANTVKQFEGNSNFVIEKVPAINGYQIFFSGADDRNIATNLALRQAIAYAIDVEGLVTGVFSGYGKPMKDCVADTSVGWLSKWNDEEYYPYNPEKAKELLAESNYNGEELVLLAMSDSTYQRLCQMIQGYLLQVGINVKLNLVDRALYSATRLDGTQYDMTINTVGGDTLADNWSLRYDMNAYKTGDGTSRHDEVLTNMLYETWTQEGFVEENIDAVHTYIKDNMYAFGTVQPANPYIWRSDLGLTTVRTTNKATIDFTASDYNS